MGALGGRQQPHPQVTSNSCNKQMNLSNSSTGSAASTLSPLRGHLSSSGIGGDLSTASGISGTNNYDQHCLPILISKLHITNYRVSLPDGARPQGLPQRPQGHPYRQGAVVVSMPKK